MTRSKSKSAGGLPDRWRRGRMVAAVFTMLLVAGAVYKLLPFSQADKLDTWWLQARFNLRERVQQSVEPDPDIVIVRMEDHCLAHWKEPTIGWGAHMADAIDRLTVSGAKVIGLDWSQPEEVGKWFPGNDEKLQQALQRANNVIWVKNVLPEKDKKAYLRPWIGFLFAQESANQDPESVLGFAEFPKGESLVASMYPVVPADASDVSFAARITECALGGKGHIHQSRWEIPGKTSVPVRENGTVLLNYASGISKGDFAEGNLDDAPFHHYSLYDVANLPDRPDPRFKNKIVLIGAAFTGGNDQHFIPFLSGIAGTRQAFGTDIQATFVRTLLRGRAIQEPERSHVWWLALALAVLGLIAFLRLPWLSAILFTLSISVIWLALSLSLFVFRDYALPTVVPLTGLMLSGVSMGGYLAFSEGRERRQVMQLWGRYQNPRVVEYLLYHPEARGGDGQETQVTVLFADLKNFTKTVESLSPGEALRVLNRYLAMLETVINEHGGIVDKYLGDGLMAQWGAPSLPGEEATTNHAEVAVRACLEIETRAKELIAAEKNEVAFGLRLTLHTGPVVVGWVGATRLEFTIIGDTVNVTSRLQETAKQLNCEFLISETTYDCVQEWVETGKQAEVEIRGRKQPLKVYEVVHSKISPARVE